MVEFTRIRVQVRSAYPFPSPYAAAKLGLLPLPEDGVTESAVTSTAPTAVHVPRLTHPLVSPVLPTAYR
jgi:hypothetical protein